MAICIELSTFMMLLLEYYHQVLDWFIFYPISIIHLIDAVNMFSSSKDCKLPHYTQIEKLGSGGLEVKYETLGPEVKAQFLFWANKFLFQKNLVR